MRRGFDSSRALRGLFLTNPGAHTAKSRGSRSKARLARLLQYVSSMLALCWPLMAASRLVAEDRVLLAEVLPALIDTPLGAVDVAAAPLPGATMTVRRADVLRALSQAGLAGSLKSENIPKATRVTRQQVVVPREQLAAQAHNAVSDAVSPCELREARFPSDVRVNSGPREYRGEFTGLRTGSVTGAVFVTSGGRVTRVPVIASLSCPPPDITSGTQLTAIVIVGNVKASAPAEARQPGRVGDVIRIVNRATGASLHGRVIDSHTVEVMP
ncbi:MAG: Chaperone for flagella basal body P-ring formation [Pseudomonadota bacterium]|jgi:hypothetical protein